MRGVGLDEPFFVARGDGAHARDRRRAARSLDWVQSWGPLIFGHADPETVEAVREAALDGTSFGAPTEREVELAEEIVDAVPSVELVRLVSSGTEAAMSAIRLARGVHAPRPRDQVRRLLPRPRRRVPRERRLRARDARDPVVARRAERRHRRHDRLSTTTTSTASRRRSSATARGSRRSSSSRSPGTWAASRRAPGFLEALRAALRRVGRAARLRRGDHRLPRRPRRRAGALRRHARPDHPREDRRRRAAARGVRRPRRRDERARARRRRLPGRDAEREPARDRGRARPCCAGCATPTVYDELERRSARLAAGSRRSAACSGSARC